MEVYLDAASLAANLLSGLALSTERVRQATPLQGVPCAKITNIIRGTVVNKHSWNRDRFGT